MKKLIEGFTRQLGEALRIGQAADLARQGSDIRNVLITGMSVVMLPVYLSSAAVPVKAGSVSALVVKLKFLPTSHSWVFR